MRKNQRNMDAALRQLRLAMDLLQRTIDEAHVPRGKRLQHTSDEYKIGRFRKMWRRTHNKEEIAHRLGISSAVMYLWLGQWRAKGMIGLNEFMA
jgi:DNA-directed RNA polymerase specialized sigma subunit